jgi:cytochrome c peroxidase
MALMNIASAGADVGQSTAANWNPAALVPMFGEDPVELGLSGSEVAFSHGFAGTTYDTLFRAAPRAADVVTLDQIVSMRVFANGFPESLRTMYSGRRSISAAARRGEELFFSEKTECFHCHGGFNFTGTSDFVGKGFAEIEFHNTGLYNIDGKGAYPARNTGVAEVSGDPSDMGRFKAPSLRNIAVTAPYMHDGSIATLEEVIEHYNAGGRTITRGPNAGNGSTNPYKSEFLKAMALTTREKRDLVAFLRSLTDSTFLRDPRFSNPWTKR